MRSLRILRRAAATKRHREESAGSSHFFQRSHQGVEGCGAGKKKGPISRLTACPGGNQEAPLEEVIILGRGFLFCEPGLGCTVMRAYKFLGATYGLDSLRKLAGGRGGTHVALVRKRGYLQAPRRTASAGVGRAPRLTPGSSVQPHLLKLIDV
jgi:hypothetical protein